MMSRFDGPVSIGAMIVLCGSVTLAAQAGFVPARYAAGHLPAIPVLAVSGGEVFLEVVVGADGRVDTIRTLRSTPPFTDAVITAVARWRFEPATILTEGGQPTQVREPVFVAAMFAPPALIGPTAGQPPQDVGSGSAELPRPTSTPSAAYPPLALGDGVVLVELAIDSGGRTTAEVKVSSPAFDATALAAARSWSFLPALRSEQRVATHAYLLFAFRQPVGR